MQLMMTEPSDYGSPAGNYHDEGAALVPTRAASPESAMFPLSIAVAGRPADAVPFYPTKPPAASVSAAAAGASQVPTGKPTGFSALDGLGLLDGLVSPGGLMSPIERRGSLGAGSLLAGALFPEAGGPLSAHAAAAAAMFGGGAAEVPEVLSCSTTPSQSPTFAHGVAMRLPPQPAAPAAPAAPATTAPATMAPAPAQATMAPAPAPAGTRRSQRRSVRDHKHSAATAASARKSAALLSSAPGGAPSRSSRSSRPSRAAKSAGRARVRGQTAAAAAVGKAKPRAVSTAAAAAVVTASLASLDNTGALPANHKPARGRGRQLQLAKMTTEQREAEAKARLEKNRQAARGFRARRKDHIKNLEAQVAGFEQREVEQRAVISSLQSEIEQLRRLLSRQR